MAEWKAYLDSNRDKFLAEFIDFLRIPSISTLAQHREDVQAAAAWLVSRMQRAGLENVEILQTDGHPMVYADWLHAENTPTLLLYGHYDVQPADPLELWETPPFDPEVRNSRLYARGASDMKGNVLLMIQACEAHLSTNGRLPVNVKFLIEGEEEIGSPSMPKWLTNNAGKVSCDFAASSDSAQISEKAPTVIVGAKGTCGLQIDVRTAPRDLHSGIGGGIVHNALHVLAQIIASMHDADMHITVDGFYDNVEMPSPEDREMCARMPLHDDLLRATLGVDSLISEPGYKPIESTWFRPTLEVNGMWGGFQGDGVKTIVPCEAHAKITCRLVTGQQPHDIVAKIKSHIERCAPKGVNVTVSVMAGAADPYLIPAGHPALQVADQALRDEMGYTPVHFRMGATVPILGILKQRLGVEVVSLGFAGLSDNIHAPNESVSLTLYHLGPKVYARFLEVLALSTR